MLEEVEPLGRVLVVDLLQPVLKVDGLPRLDDLLALALLPTRANGDVQSIAVVGSGRNLGNVLVA